MADIKFFIIKIRKYRGILLALMVIMLTINFYLLDNFGPTTKEQSLSPSSTDKSVPQHPVIFTSKGAIEAKIIYREPSFYGDIVVFDYYDSTRCFLIDGILESCWNIQKQNPTIYTRDMKFLLQSIGTKRDIKDILIIGVGAGTLLRDLDNSGYSIDGVEVNPKMLEVARDYFLLPQNLDYQIIIDDGRHYLSTTDKKYDAIVLDICYANQSNVHLWTKEFYNLAKNHLKDPETGFIIASRNTVNDEQSKRLDYMIAKAMHESFTHFYSVEKLKKSPGEFDVWVFMATNQPTTISSVVRKNKSQELRHWNFDSTLTYAPTTDEKYGEILQLFWPATEKIREQTLHNFGGRILLPI